MSRVIWRPEHLEELERIYHEKDYRTLKDANETLVQLGRREVVNFVRGEVLKQEKLQGHPHGNQAFL